MKIEGKKILFLGAHADDVEIGCGGTLFKLKPKNEIYIRTFSSCEESVPKGFDKDTLQKEFLGAMDFLQPNNFDLLDFPVRRFSEHRQDILETLYSFGKELKPDIVFYHSELDKHQDHAVINQEAYRAFKKNSILITYEVPNNSVSSEFNYFIALNEWEVTQKIKLISFYKTQAFKHQIREEVIRAILVCDGVQIDTKYAEKFKIVKTKWVD